MTLYTFGAYHIPLVYREHAHKRTAIPTDMRKSFLSFILLVSAFSSVAGSRGFTAVMVSVGSQEFFESSAYRKYLEADFVVSREAQECWDRSATGGAHIAWIIRKEIPDGLTPALINAVWRNDSLAAMKMRATLRKSKAPDGRNDVDGIFVFDASNGKVSAMSLGSRPPIGPSNPSKKVTITWNGKDAERGAADLDMLLCDISKPLGYGFGP